MKSIIYFMIGYKKIEGGMLMKYIMQNINAYTGELLREMNYGDFSQTMACIEYYEKVKKNRDKNEATIVLIDSEKKMWDAEYIGYSIDESKMHEGIIIYISFFKVRLRPQKVHFDKVK